MIDIVRKLDKMREDRGLSIYQLALDADVSQQTLHKWFDTDTTPSIPALKKVCDVFGITLAELFSEYDLVEVTPEMKELYDNWKCLTKDEQSSVKQIVDNYVKNKRK